MVSKAADPANPEFDTTSVHVRTMYTQIGGAMTNQFTSTPRNQRINLRATKRQETLLKKAASITDTSITNFILNSATTEAERVLADRRWFIATPEQHQKFVELLDQPFDTTRLTALLASPSPFEKPFQLENE